MKIIVDLLVCHENADEYACLSQKCLRIGVCVVKLFTDMYVCLS